MLSSVSVKNFQSLKSVELQLSPFTVVVGNSSCGKSALVRALQALSSNIRGHSFVTMGENTSVVSAQSEEWKVTLEKGENHGVYKLYDGVNIEEREYTKLGGTVPSDITKRLKIDPVVEGISVNFSNQDDKPYLLSDSGQFVARELGELTNVSVIFEAVREANRRRSESSRLLKTRKEDLVRITDKAKKFSSLPKKREAIKKAEFYYSTAIELKNRIKLLSSLEDDCKLSESLVLPNIPDLSAVQSLFRIIQHVKGTMQELLDSEESIKLSVTEIEKYDILKTTLEEELHQLLTDAGRCPLCDQDIR